MYDILDFTKRRFQEDCHWTDGNCYWFAYILKTRFPELNIYLLPIENHFMAGDGKLFYDWLGEHVLEDLPEQPILFEKLQEVDSAWYERLVENCVK